MKWQQKLTKKERAHLKENEMITLGDVIENRRQQIKLMDSDPGSREICWECRIIVLKLS